jgi:hypothetical protein
MGCLVQAGSLQEGGLWAVVAPFYAQDRRFFKVVRYVSVYTRQQLSCSKAALAVDVLPPGRR